MDHSEAVKVHAAEKYVLGELPPDLREQYEEHYFECVECAEELKATLAFVSVAREVVGEEPAPVSEVQKEKSARPGWASWFRPAVFVPAMAALVLAIGYYSFSSRPQVGEITAPGQVLDSSPSFGLRGGDRLENEKTVLQVHGSEAFQLHFDFVPTQDHTFTFYTGELQDKSARVLLRFDIPLDRINKEVNLLVPAGMLRPGDYRLAIFGHDASSSARTAVGKFVFALQYQP